MSTVEKIKPLRWEGVDHDECIGCILTNLGFTLSCCVASGNYHQDERKLTVRRFWDIFCAKEKQTGAPIVLTGNLREDDPSEQTVLWCTSDVIFSLERRILRGKDLENFGEKYFHSRIDKYYRRQVIEAANGISLENFDTNYHPDDVILDIWISHMRVWMNEFKKLPFVYWFCCARTSYIDHLKSPEVAKVYLEYKTKAKGLTFIDYVLALLDLVDLDDYSKTHSLIGVFFKRIFQRLHEKRSSLETFTSKLQYFKSQFEEIERASLEVLGERSKPENTTNAENSSLNLDAEENSTQPFKWLTASVEPIEKVAAIVADSEAELEDTDEEVVEPVSIAPPPPKKRKRTDPKPTLKKKVEPFRPFVEPFEDESDSDSIVVEPDPFPVPKKRKAVPKKIVKPKIVVGRKKSKQKPAKPSKPKPRIPKKTSKPKPRLPKKASKPKPRLPKKASKPKPRLPKKKVITEKPRIPKISTTAKPSRKRQRAHVKLEDHVIPTEKPTGLSDADWAAIQLASGSQRQRKRKNTTFFTPKDEPVRKRARKLMPKPVFLNAAKLGDRVLKTSFPNEPEWYETAKEVLSEVIFGVDSRKEYGLDGLIKDKLRRDLQKNLYKTFLDMLKAAYQILVDAGPVVCKKLFTLIQKEVSKPDNKELQSPECTKLIKEWIEDTNIARVKLIKREVKPEVKGEQLKDECEGYVQAEVVAALGCDGPIEINYKGKIWRISGDRRDGSWLSSIQKANCLQNIHFILGTKNVKYEGVGFMELQMGQHLTQHARIELRQMVNEGVDLGTQAKKFKSAVKQMKSGKWKATIYTDTLGSSYDTAIDCIRARDQIYWATRPKQFSRKKYGFFHDSISKRCYTASLFAITAKERKILAKRTNFKRKTAKMYGTLWHVTRQRWCSRVNHKLTGEKKGIFCGYYATEKEAADAHDVMLFTANGEEEKGLKGKINLKKKELRKVVEEFRSGKRRFTTRWGKKHKLHPRLKTFQKAAFKWKKRYKEGKLKKKRNKSKKRKKKKKRKEQILTIMLWNFSFIQPKTPSF